MCSSVFIVTKKREYNLNFSLGVLEEFVMDSFLELLKFDSNTRKPYDVRYFMFEITSSLGDERSLYADLKSHMVIKHNMFDSLGFLTYDLTY